MGHESPDVLPNYIFEQYHIILFILFFISMNYVRTMIIDTRFFNIVLLAEPQYASELPKFQAAICFRYV